MTKEAEAIYNSIREWHERDCSENHNDPSIYFAYRRLADHLVATSPAPDAGLVEREAIAQVLLDRFIERGSVRMGGSTFPRGTDVRTLVRSYRDDFYADADAILALLSTRAVAGEPVAWRWHPKGDADDGWVYTENAGRVKWCKLFGHPCEPLYAHPAPSGCDHIPDFRKMAGRDPATIKAAYRCVPVDWRDPLLTGEAAAGLPHFSKPVEALLRGIQDRIKALAAPAAQLTEDGETP